jgi:hypothetical protein
MTLAESGWAELHELMTTTTASNSASVIPPLYKTSVTASSNMIAVAQGL